MLAKILKKVSILSKISILLIKIYQITLSGAIGRNCRFYPSCSDYAILIIKDRGFFVGWYYAIKRIIRCNPWGSSGFDYPPKKGKCNCDENKR